VEEELLSVTNWFVEETTPQETDCGKWEFVFCSCVELLLQVEQKKPKTKK